MSNENALTIGHSHGKDLFDTFFVTQACPGGGSGKGRGGAPYLQDGSPNPYKNCEPQGNILIIQEADKSCPDDSWAGGWLQFDFRVKIEVFVAKLLDIDEGITPKIEVWHKQDQYTEFKTAPTGDTYSERTGETESRYE